MKTLSSLIRAVQRGALEGKSLADLVEIAGLDPSVHFRHLDLRNGNFEKADLTNFNLTGALLDGANFKGAKILGAKIDSRYFQGDLLAEAADYEMAYSRNAVGILFHASEIGDSKAISRVISRLENIDIRRNMEPDRESALIVAATKGHLPVVELLVEYGADVNLRDRSGTALVYAAAEGHKSVVEFLIGKGAYVDLAGVGERVHPALAMASGRGDEAVARLLLAAGADINYKTDTGWTALMMASSNGKAHIVRILLENGADVNEVTVYRQTALKLSHKYAEIREMLIASGAVELDI